MESFKRIMGKIGHFLNRHKGWLIFIVLIFIGITAYRYITRSSERKEEMSSGKMTETQRFCLSGIRTDRLILSRELQREILLMKLSVLSNR